MLIYVKPRKVLYCSYNFLPAKHWPEKHFYSLVTLTHLSIFSAELSLYFAISF